MKQKIHVQLEIALEQCHELVALKLRLQKVINGNQSAGAGDLDMAARSLNREYADLVARDGQVDLVPVAVRGAAPADQRPLIHELASTVFVTAEFGHTPAALKLALVVVLAGKGKEELFLSVVGIIILANCSI